MKLKKNILTILLVVLLFLLIGSVSAADTNDTQISYASGNDEILSVGNDVDILGDGEYSYTYLREQINSGGDIRLAKGNYTYAYGDGDTIQISTPGVIDGNGAVIDMAGLGRAFYVTAEYGVTIKNLTIKNANFNGDGGAIYFSNSGTVENCNFIDNQATGDDGAVYFEGTGTVTNCNFTANQATSGGAIQMFSGSVENCNFTANQATGDGGAIFMSSGSVKNCNFTANQATGSNSWGGAIRMGSGSVTNCNFTANQATSGGAIRMFSGSVKNCNFTGNNATTGSAIYFYITSATKTLSNSIFLNNRANKEALEVTKNENNITITFTGNDNLLNAIYSENDAEVSFTNVTYWGANGITNTGISEIKPSRSNKEAGQNITVEIYDSNDQLVENVTLVTDDNGQVTYDFIKLSNGNYKYKSYHSEDCYYTYAEYNDTFTLESDLGDFNRLQKYINGAKENSILTLCRNYTFTIGADENLTGGIVIDKPLTINGNGHTIDALQKARIFHVTASSINITGLTFKNGKADKGGAIYFENAISNSNINASFINNTANYGGANYFNDVVSNSNINGTYNHNTANYGGANHFDMSVSNSNINGTYNHNTAKDDGGANLFFWSVSNSNINGTYNHNTAKNGDGGANHFDMSVSNSNINGTYNHNTANYGGANLFYGDVSNSNITGTYINNTATNAIIHFENYYNQGLDAYITNAIFLNNKCTYEIYAPTPGVMVKDSWFGNNASNYMNKPNVNENIQIDNWLFLNATADYSSLLVMDSSNITFKLYSTNGTNVSDFDNSKLPVINLTLTATNGDVEKTTTLDNIVKYMATEKGKGSVTAKIENASYTIYFDNSLRNVDLSVSAQNITYLENEVLTLTYNNTATGKINITLKSKNYNKTIERDINQTITIADLPAGEYDVVVEYFGDNVFSNATAYANFTVNKITTEVIQDNETIELFVDEESKITYTLKPDYAIGNISFYSNDSTIVSVDSLSGDIIAKGEGSANITISFSGSENYTASNATIKVNVKRIPTQITVNSSAIDMKVNGETNIDATLEPADAGNLTYTVSNPSVVKVENGKITALKEGNATITVSFAGNKKYLAAENKTINVTVSLNDASVSVNNDTLDLLVDDKFNLIATTEPKDLTVNYTSSNPSVVTVDNEGNVVAVGEGNATITVSVGGDGKYVENSTTVTVTVSKVPTEITVNPDSLNLLVGNESSITATLTPADAGNVTFTSSDKNIANVDNQGNVIAVGEGNATLTVSFEGNNKYAAADNVTVTVTVNKVPTEINIKNDTLKLEVNDEISTGATLTPADAGNVTYNISNSSVVKVEDDKIIALAEGEAIISVSFAGDNKYAASENKTISVTVKLKDASVSVENATLDILVGDNDTIIAVTTPKDLNVTYVPDNSGVVSVDNKGIVTALKEGTATITVKVGGDGVYAENSTTVTVTVSKIPTEISVENKTINLLIEESVNTGATLAPEEAGNLTYTSSDESVAIVKDGKIMALKEGDAVITVSFKGDNKYAAAESKTINISVKKLNATMDVSADEITEGENATISITLPNDATGNVNTTVNGKTYSSEVKDGKAVITIPDLIKGDYTLPVNYSGDDKYNPLTKDVNLTVKEDEIIVSAPDLTKYYSGYEPFIVNVTYARGVPIADKEVKITINGVTYTKITDEDGIASLSINLNSKTYDVTTVVDDIIVNSLVTILPTIEAEDVESKSKNIVFTATFLDSEGNYLIDGTNVSFNIGGVIYNSQVSGDKGLASIDLILDRGRYLITSQNTVTYENAVNSIAVDLKDADMILSGDEISVGEKATISVTLPSDTTGNVTATINGKTYTSQVKNGEATITIPDLSAGNHTVPVTYSGDNKYNSASGNTSINVNKVNAAMTVDAPAITVGENATVTVTLPEDAAGNVTIRNETVPVKDGAASAVLTDLPVGTNTVQVTYSGDDKYNPIETSADVVVNEKPVPAKENLTIKATAGEITKGEDAVINVTGLENATGNVSASVNGRTYTAPIEDGKAVITVPGLTENATAFVNYPGDEKYNPAMTSVNITVNKGTVIINAQNLTKYYGGSERFVVTVTDSEGNPLENITVKINIGGKNYTRTTDANGTASMAIGLPSNTYNVTVTVDEQTVNAVVTVLSTVNGTDVVKMYRNATQYYATFLDSEGKYLAEGTTVNFNINGVFYERQVSGDKGLAKLNINLPEGEYIITAMNPVTGEKAANNITVLATLVENTDITKYYKNGTQYTVKVLGADGKAVGAGVSVKFNINGVIYTRTTNESGIAKLNINLAPGDYIITAEYKDYKVSNNITVVPVLTAKDVTMKYRDGTKFVATLVDGQGKAFAGQNVQFNINGVLYTRATDSAGQAKLNINLMAGEYIITSSYNGANIANKITIRG